MLKRDPSYWGGTKRGYDQILMKVVPDLATRVSLMQSGDLDMAENLPPQQALQAMMRAYLSKEHIEGVETGCAVAALGSEMPRQAPEVRRAATRRIKEMIDLVARQSPDWGQPGAHKRALVTVATMVGALVLARAVDDPRLSDALRDAALKHLIPAGD